MKKRNFVAIQLLTTLVIVGFSPLVNAEQLRLIVDDGKLVAENGAFRFTEKDRESHPSLAKAPF